MNSAILAAATAAHMRKARINKHDKAWNVANLYVLSLQTLRDLCFPDFVYYTVDVCIKDSDNNIRMKIQWIFQVAVIGKGIRITVSYSNLDRIE